MKLGLSLGAVLLMGVGVAIWIWQSQPEVEPEKPALTLVPKPELVPEPEPAPPPTEPLADGARVHVAKDSADRAACSRCHASADEPAIKTAKIGELCAECHQAPHVDKSHLTEVPLPLGMKTWLPLAADGYMTCATCHDPHGQSPRLMRGGGTIGDVCRSCHVGY